MVVNFLQTQVARWSTGIGGQRFLTAITGKQREGGGFHVTRTHRTETVGNLSILNTTSLAIIQSET